ncbi:hypothetical protein LTR91_025513 [Friedmanniomyces endolithicus]|uniref:Linalool dehydratase/isomerase domain-containing protein n=1 Tax=Friedmanniomyces endolithicus TaxID=329885 RepID=A0AAN6K2Y9_9PEZI|nr:hypothetical protein LTR57_025216 [Friedmanniomyces endolithicus]KAK0950649.1 hypothetical protein LTR91_025513 [Friedmanniomyces endolithicus]KAK0951466.1 hypothetical protein LTS01_025240 [Friedmanniomyces endolithicus]KAK1021735.1 hypothetical protein LTS16_026289 [Friedmanniomyces endolithicus]
MLFSDGEFDKSDSLVFNWDPIFFGMGPESFKYNRLTLQQAILTQMEQGGWMGVCCEPNMVFIVCNQFPLIATRYTDVFNGTNMIDEVLPKYKAAWDKRGMMAENGLFRSHYAPRRDVVVDAKEISHSGWISAFLVWDREMVERVWPSLTLGFVHRTEGRINIRPSPVANAIRDIVNRDGGDPDSPSVVTRAQDIAAGKPKTSRKYLGPVFGHVAQGMSEVVGSPDLDALLLHADTYLQPSWVKGGLYYARRSTDDYWDAEGNYTYGEPHTGNACIGYARLNVKGGQRKMWEHPWTRDEVEKRPWVDGIGFEMDVDCLSGRWDSGRQAMIVAFRTWNGKEVNVTAVVRNLPPGMYGIYINGEQRNVAQSTDSEPVAVALAIAGQDVELVLLRA